MRLFRHPAFAGVPTFDTLTLASDGSNEVFVAKYNDAGRINWASRVTGTGDDKGISSSVDSLGNVYLTGRYDSNPITIYNADGTSFGTLANSGTIDSFIVKYNDKGIVQWRTRIAGSNDDITSSIATDSSGNVYVTGNYRSSPLTIFNANGTSFGTLANSGITDTFIVKYNTSGTAQWATRIAGTRFDQGMGISVDSSGNVYVTGDYDSATLTIFNADGGTFGTLTGPGFFNNDVFLIKYNTSGIAQWATKIAGSNEETGTSISVDSSGNVYVAGNYMSTSLTAFNVGGASFGSVANSGSRDNFIVKYNTSGVAQWITRLSGTSLDLLYGITVDSSGNVYVTGSYGSNPLTIYNAGGASFGTLTLTGSDDVFVVKYNTSGIAQWATRLTGTTSEYGLGISADSTGNIYVIGFYTFGSLSAYNADGSLFTGTGMPLSNVGAGTTDVFIMKYNSSGNAVWGTRLTGTGDDRGNMISVNDTTVAVCGYYSSNPLTLRSVGF